MKETKKTTQNKRKKVEYPESLTLDESEKYVWLYSGEDETEAYKIAKKRNGQVYTQVDVESEDGVVYLRCFFSFFHINHYLTNSVISVPVFVPRNITFPKLPYLYFSLTYSSLIYFLLTDESKDFKTQFMVLYSGFIIYL